MTSLRGGLVGCGSVAPFHLAAWRAVPGVELVAVADPRADRAADLAREFGVPRVYADAEELLARERLDFVDVATGPAHREPVRAAARWGVHVLCQKPFAGSLDEGRELLGMCAAAGVRCVVNENWRWRAWYREVGRLVQAGAVGVPRHARFAVHTDDVLPLADGSPPPLLVRQPYTAVMPRLLLFEWGVHLFDVLRFLLGDVAEVAAATGRRSPLVAGEDWARVRLAFVGGATADLDLSWSTPVADGRRLPRGSVEPFVLDGDAGRIELDPFRDDALVVNGVTTPARGDRTRAEAYQDSYTAAHRHFADCLQTGRPAETEAADSLNTLAAVFAAYDSAAAGGAWRPAHASGGQPSGKSPYTAA